jgi:hypothetical protein
MVVLDYGWRSVIEVIPPPGWASFGSRGACLLGFVPSGLAGPSALAPPAITAVILMTTPLVFGAGSQAARVRDKRESLRTLP